MYKILNIFKMCIFRYWKFLLVLNFKAQKNEIFQKLNVSQKKKTFFPFLPNIPSTEMTKKKWNFWDLKFVLEKFIDFDLEKNFSSTRQKIYFLKQLKQHFYFPCRPKDLYYFWS